MKNAGETVQILVEFLEVAITSIVFLKGIYPSGETLSLIYAFFVAISCFISLKECWLHEVYFVVFLPSS